MTRWSFPVGRAFRLIEPLLRAGLWAFAFWIGYRLQIRLEHRHVDGRELAYLISATLCLAVAAWPRRAEAGAVDDAPATRFFARNGRWKAIAAPFCVVAAAAALGIFFRTYDLNTRPEGIWYDEAQNGLIARRILDGDFPPMFIGLDTQLPSAFFYVYALFAWVMGEGVLSLRVVSTIGGLAALPMVFLLARALFDVRTAALAVFLLAVMRWQVNLSRFGVTNIFASFFVLGAVYFFVRGLRGGPRWSLVASGVFLGLTPYAGFYGVFAPIVIGLFWLHAGIFERVLPWRRHFLALVIVTFAALAAYSPVAAWGLKNGDAYLSRPGTASISQGKTTEETYHAVLTSTRKHLLMFNSLGDSNGRHNLPAEPMLDRFTGILFLLGVGLSVLKLRRSSHFLLLIWVAAFLQNGIWSVSFEAPQAFRSSVVTPAVAMLAALPLAALWNIALRSRVALPGAGGVRAVYARGQEWVVRAGIAGGIAILLGMIAHSNYDTYFNKQLESAAVWRAFNTDVTLAAEATKGVEDGDRVLMSSLFSSPVIKYVNSGITDLAALHLDLHRDVPLGDARRTVILLDATKEADVAWIKQLYPSAEVTEFRAPGANEMPSTYKMVIPADAIGNLLGLRAVYERPGEAPVEVKEPSIDFDWSSQPPPLPFPFHASWSGIIRFPDYEDHLLSVIAPGTITLSIDDREVAVGADRVDFPTAPYRGLRAISINVNIDRPGKVTLLDRGEPVPASALFSGGALDVRHGLVATFYHNLDFADPPAFQQLDPFVGFRNHNELPFPSNFTAVWRGHLNVVDLDEYTFSLEPVDAASLTIDGKVVIDFPGQVVGTTMLTAGDHTIEVRFRNGGGYAGMFFRWQREGGPREIVPSERLSP